MSKKNKKPGRPISIEIVGRVENRDTVQSGLRLVESGLVFNKNEGPFFFRPGVINDIGTMMGLGLLANGISILIKNLEHIQMSKPEHREAIIQGVTDKIRECLIMSDSISHSNLDDI